MNVLVSISYLGSNFDGFQMQPNKRTVQGEIENVLSKIFNTKIKITGSGRTDKGVHALNQYFNFYIDNYDLDLLLYKLNKLLPQDIKVNNLRPVPDSFNARLSAVEKKYKYMIELNNRNPFTTGQVYTYYDKVNIKKLSEIAAVFEGKHCFQNFTSKKEDKLNFVRIISKIDISCFENRIEIDFAGSGFMKYEVRMIVGNMLAYASGKITKTEIKNKLNSKERNITNLCVPGEGLYLVDVKYNLDKGQNYNYHTHTFRCGHAIGKVEEYVEHAVANGFKYLGFSDHVFLKQVHQPGMRGEYFELNDYLKEIDEAQEKYKGKIKLYKGFECEYDPKFVDEYKELLKKVDYLILGQHCYFDDDFSWHWYTKETDNYDMRYKYCFDLIEGMKSGLFKYVCHPDLFMQGLTEYDPRIQDICNKICEASLEYDIPLEINLQGWIKYGRDLGLNKKNFNAIPYPNEIFWKTAGSYQCKVVIGVDAHNPLDFDKSSYDLALKFIDDFALNYISNYKINK